MSPASPEAEEQQDTCPVQMADGRPCGRPIYISRYKDPEPVCLMHSYDPDKDTQTFHGEIEAILAGTSKSKAADKCDFTRFVFPVANFTGKEFALPAIFCGAEFRGEALFTRAKFKADANFWSVTFTDTADFDQVIFTGATYFAWTKFARSTDFAKARFAQTADFSGASFLASAQFTDAGFTEDARFVTVTFSGITVFRGVTFTRDATFAGATFTRGADFGGATFRETANFVGATFTEAAEFVETTFTQTANFAGATFTKASIFVETTFTQAAEFEAATFAQTADFMGATFIQTAKFRRATFSQAAYFAWTTFTQTANFRGATFTQTANFNAATFAQDAEFRFAKFDQPSRVVFQQVNKRNPSGFRARFLNCPIEALNFVDVHWHTRNGRMVLQDELDIMAGKDEDHELVATAYRQLVNNFERTRNYELAEQCFLGAMEMRRLDPRNFPFSRWERVRGFYRKHKRVRKLAAFLSVVSAYGLLSKYGSSYTRALWVLGWMILALTLLFPLFGLHMATGSAPQPPLIGTSVICPESATISWCRAWNHAEPRRELWGTFKAGLWSTLEVATFQRRPTIQPATTWGRRLGVIEVVIIPGQLALLFLALRRRFRR